MHTKSDSEVTSLPGSSPPRSPRSRPLYFVQSPSRDSHDGDSKVSFHSTPILLSPIGSPLHPHSGPGAGHGVPAFSTSSRSRDDSSQSLLLPHSSRSHKASRHSHSKHHHHHKNSPVKPWAARNVINEEEAQYSYPSNSIAPQIYLAFLVLLSCAAFLFVFIFLFWLICRPEHPQISLKNVVFHNFYMGEGADPSGVPTKMVSLNCTVQLNYYNPSKYFGVHASPVDAQIYYSELKIGNGEILEYYQQKGMRKTIHVVVQAAKVPIYGASTELSSTYDAKHGIPLNMVATVHSQYYVVGKMVKPKFQNQVSCNIVLNSVTMSLLTPLKSSCVYSPALPSKANQ